MKSTLFSDGFSLVIVCDSSDWDGGMMEGSVTFTGVLDMVASCRFGFVVFVDMSAFGFVCVAIVWTFKV